MATKPAPKAAPAPAAKTATITRKRRNALERRSLPKDLKRQFVGASSAVNKILLAAWKDSRKKAPAKV